MTWLVIVPARAGSKGVPGKNVAEVGGRPLVAYTLQTSKEVVDATKGAELLVSTDDERVRAIAEEMGISVPFLRPAALSGDNARSYDFVVHALDWWARWGKSFEFVLILQPTCPLRTVDGVRDAMRWLENSPGKDSLISGFRTSAINPDVLYDPGEEGCAVPRWLENSPGKDSLISGFRTSAINPDVLYDPGEEGCAVPIVPTHGAGGRRQEVPEVLVRNGTLYGVRTSFLRQSGKLICDRPLFVEMPEADSINVDAPADLKRLRQRFSDE